MSGLKAALEKLLLLQDLSEEEAAEAMNSIMKGEATEAQMAAFLTALRLKGETVDEITAFARVMREFATKINPSRRPLVDTCGTGGDRIKTFNISTAAMFVVAGAGVAVAKHGNRSVTSKAGSADVVEALGVKIDLPPSEVERCIDEIGLGFMFAPLFHPAMKQVAKVRREMGIRTVFNILGPLTNPAGATAQLLGVFDEAMTEKMARVLLKLGSERAMVVHGIDGLDEISTIGKTKIAEVREGKVVTRVVQPEDFWMRRASPADLGGMTVEENARVLLRVLKGEKGPRRDIVVLNAAAALVVGGLVEDILEGIPIAEESIDSGMAYRKLQELVEATGGSLETLRRMEELL
ncbi:MAG: anthranilate phosphoribosyltransferase [Candidatus Hadarchaeales archaeon]